MALNSWHSYPHLPSPVHTGMHHHTKLLTSIMVSFCLFGLQNVLCHFIYLCEKCHRICVWVTRKHREVKPLLPLSDSRRSNTGHQTWQQAHLYREPSFHLQVASLSATVLWIDIVSGELWSIIKQHLYDWYKRNYNCIKQTP